MADIKTRGFTMPDGNTHIYIPPVATETDAGGFKAKTKTTENQEIAIDPTTGKAYAPAPDATLTQTGVAADAKVVGDELTTVKNELNTLNQGGLILKDPVIAKNVQDWLNTHPEATTTVQDGSLIEAKIQPEFLKKIKNDYVTPEMFGAVGDGITDDTIALKEAVKYKCVKLTYNKKYLISQPIDLIGCLLAGNGTSVNQIITNTNMPYLISYDNASGIRDMTLIGSQKCTIGLKDNSTLDVKSCLFIKNLRVKQFTERGIEYLNGWQSEIHDLYISSCKYGLYITGSDINIHDINISGCKCGMYVSCGTVKIVNIKIDNCTSNLSENFYPLYFASERGHLSNAEVQFCRPNGAFLSGENLTVASLLLDGIGRGLTETEVTPYGNAIEFGVLKHSDINILLHNQMPNTNDVKLYNGQRHQLKYTLTNSNINIYASRKTLFTPLKNDEMYEIANLEHLKKIATTNIDATNNVPVGQSISIKFEKNNFPEIDFSKIKGISLDIKFKQITNTPPYINIYSQGKSLIGTDFDYIDITNNSSTISTVFNKDNVLLDNFYIDIPLSDKAEQYKLLSANIVFYYADGKKKYSHYL